MLNSSIISSLESLCTIRIRMVCRIWAVYSIIEYILIPFLTIVQFIPYLLDTPFTKQSCIKIYSYWIKSVEQYKNGKLNNRLSLSQNQISSCVVFNCLQKKTT